MKGHKLPDGRMISAMCTLQTRCCITQHQTVQHACKEGEKGTTSTTTVVQRGWTACCHFFSSKNELSTSQTETDPSQKRKHRPTSRTAFLFIYANSLQFPNGPPLSGVAYFSFGGFRRPFELRHETRTWVHKEFMFTFQKKKFIQKEHGRLAARGLSYQVLVAPRNFEDTTASVSGSIEIARRVNVLTALCTAHVVGDCFSNS